MLLHRNAGAPFWAKLFANDNASNGGGDVFRKGYEAYGRHARQQAPVTDKHQPWGNSQFSIRRDTLADLRYDEEYVGYGLEDQDLMMRLEHRLGESYRSFIWTDGQHAMFHLEHPPGEWRQDRTYEANWARYTAKRKRLRRPA